MTELTLFNSASLAIKRSNLETGVIEGYASVFRSTPDHHGERFAPGAFKKSLSRHRARNTRPSMLWGHDSREVIGKWSHIEEDAHGLLVVGKLNLEIARARDAFALIKEGDVTGLSVGANVLDRTFKDEVPTITEADLVEVSVVHLGADDEAKITAFKHLGSKAEAISLLREAGLSKSAATRFAAGGWPALQSRPDLHLKASRLADQVNSAIQKLKEIEK